MEVSNQEKEPLAADHDNGPGLLPLVTSPRVFLLLITVSMSAVNVSWLESLLSLYLTSQFSLSLSAVGFCFLLWSVVNTAGKDKLKLRLTSLFLSSAYFLAGWASDKLPDPSLICLLGQILLVISHLMTGPAPYLPLSPSLPLTLAGLVILGLGSAIILVTTYTSCLKATLETPGYPETEATYSLVSGLHNAAYSLGTFIGPSIAGIMYQKVLVNSNDQYWSNNNQCLDGVPSGK